MVATPTFDPEALSHNRWQCLECMLTMKTPGSSLSSEMLHHISHVTPTSSLSLDVRSQTSSSVSSGTSVGLSAKGGGGGKRTREAESSTSKSPEVTRSAESSRDSKVANGPAVRSREGRGGGEGAGRDQPPRGERGERDRSPGGERHRSASPLIRMKRVESDDGNTSTAAPTTVEDHKERGSGSPEPRAETQVGSYWTHSQILI